MPTPSFWINPNDKQLKTKVESLTPTPGYCIFIDISGSTKMKQNDLRQWIALIHNCFSNANTFLPPFPPIKSIGDALMYFIEVPDLKKSGESALQIFDGLWQIATESDTNFPAVKIGAARCEQVYSLTFFQNNQDYYGIDIDMAARLQSLAQDRQVVIEKRLYDEIVADYNGIGNQDQFESFQRLTGPKLETLKGIPNPIEVYRT